MDNTDGGGGHEHDLDDLRQAHLPADIGRSLKLGRQRRGWSLRTAERNLGISFSYLCHLEIGNRVPSSVVLNC